MLQWKSSARNPCSKKGGAESKQLPFDSYRRLERVDVSVLELASAITGPPGQQSPGDSKFLCSPPSNCNVASSLMFHGIERCWILIIQ
jgi:hypothetical protein